MKSFLFILLICPRLLLAHCQVPCGIYGDENKFAELFQHVATIEKAVTELSQTEGAQHTRWVLNKESHAQKIQTELMDYFLTQRIKDSQSNYGDLLAHLHRVAVAAMKCKQSTEKAEVEKLNSALEEFQKAYLKSEDS